LISGRYLIVMTTLKKDYTELFPETVMDAVESFGYDCSGRMLALNSYENRVYRLDMEDDVPIIAKFYRPERWSDAAIHEEHQFAIELAEQEIPVVAPLVFDGKTLLESNGYRFALYPLQGGRWPDLETMDDRMWVGRFIARIHAIGSKGVFRERHQIEIERMAVSSSQFLMANDFIPSHLEVAYQTLTDDLIALIKAQFEKAGAYTSIRLHGDCHRSNILWTDNGPHFVDLDDCCNGPAIQDLWMLLSGERAEMTEQLCDLLEGYNDFAEIDLSQLHLIEALRSLRMMHYAAWLAKRWQDPAFPLAFPWFNTDRYWEDHVLELREQFSRMQEPVLVV